jgi:hypothetical protein
MRVPKETQHSHMLSSPTMVRLSSGVCHAFSSTAINDTNTLVVFYRGGWCPFCNFQIRELSQSHDKTTTKWRYRQSSSFETARSPGLTSPETTRRVRAPSSS